MESESHHSEINTMTEPSAADLIFFDEDTQTYLNQSELQTIHKPQITTARRLYQKRLMDDIKESVVDCEDRIKCFVDNHSEFKAPHLATAQKDFITIPLKSIKEKIDALEILL